MAIAEKKKKKDNLFFYSFSHVAFHIYSSALLLSYTHTDAEC